jgi:hypothetical protein
MQDTPSADRGRCCETPAIAHDRRARRTTQPAAAAPQWQRARAAARLDAPRRGAADGYAIEDVELWAPAGQLVLQARRQRRILGGG